ncbi:small ribosomal subunit protein uS15m isoform X1 [Paramormyrops kingsleyae]|uniref:small ribosomal subunit protein uS15m isoform X1 n=1 Tax=Paramormyrops kingsleyae TaxID=1676925 RepID=UPI000CD5F65C|nr:28S ribosomal protein S15, mitochondrial isoform X1 [Paramormyrops kingsleyae]
MLRVLKSAPFVCQYVAKPAFSALLPVHGSACLSVAARPLTRISHGRGHEALGGSFAVQAVRHYARPSRRKKAPPSQLDDLSPATLKKDYAEVPLLNTADDLIKRLLSLELGSHKDRLKVKEQQLVEKVRRDDHDRSSTEVKVALLTARIRNYQEHMHKHPKVRLVRGRRATSHCFSHRRHRDKANKRRMLMAIDRRKKHLKYLRRTRHDAFELVCQQLGITYTLPPPYYRTLTKRWMAKKAFCTKVFEVIQRRRAKEKEARKEAAAAATVVQEAAEQDEDARGTAA